MNVYDNSYEIPKAKPNVRCDTLGLQTTERPVVVSNGATDYQRRPDYYEVLDDVLPFDRESVRKRGEHDLGE